MRPVARGPVAMGQIAMGQIAMVCLILATIVSPPALGAVAKVASCPPGKQPNIQTLQGMFTVHVVCDRVMFEIPPKMLNRDILANTEFAALPTASDFVAPGSAVDNRVIRLTRLGNKVYLEDVRYEIWARAQSNLQRGVEAASLRTALRAFDIIREGKGGAPIIDITGILVSEVPAGFALDLMRQFHMRMVDPRRSYVQSVKAFPENIDIRFYQTWVPDPADLFKPGGDDEKRTTSLGFIFHTSLHLLPEHPMQGRYWDERVGYFAVTFDDYGTEEHGKVSRGYIQRFRLEKKDINAAVSEPVKPIVFLISPEVPEEWRPYIKRGIEDWQQVFEKAGFRNAILARDAPTPKEDPDWDPEDVRYNVIRWTPSGRANAMGPAVIDPRTGEVISSHAIFFHNVLRLAERWYFTQVGPLDPRAKKLPLPNDLMGELLRYVVSHEIGHAHRAAPQLQGALGLLCRAAAQPRVDRALGQHRLDHGLCAHELRRAAGRQRLPAAEVRPLRLLRHRLGLPPVHRDGGEGRQEGHPIAQQRRRDSPSWTRSPRGRSTTRCCASAAKTTPRRSTPKSHQRGRWRPDRGRRSGAAQHRPGGAHADPGHHQAGWQLPGAARDVGRAGHPALSRAQCGREDGRWRGGNPLPGRAR